MSWMIPPNKLDAEQRTFLDQFSKEKNQSCWIRGFAGTGKTVLLAYTLLQARKDVPHLKACIVLYTHSLIDMVKAGLPEGFKDTPIMTFRQFEKKPEYFDLILVDEVQDLPYNILRLLKNSSRRLIVAGDENQSIYDNTVSYEDINNIVDRNCFPLSVIHRLNPKIINIAGQFCRDERMFAANSNHTGNIDVLLGAASDNTQETGYIWNEASSRAANGYSTAILLPNRSEINQFINSVLIYKGLTPWKIRKNKYNKEDYSSLNYHLSNLKLNAQYFGNGYGSVHNADSTNLINIMTYHSAKGLDFNNVFLPRLNKYTKIFKDQKIAEQLFFVALTRSRMNLYMTYSGEPHEFVNRIPKQFVIQTRIQQIASANHQPETNNDDDFIF